VAPWGRAGQSQAPLSCAAPRRHASRVASARTLGGTKHTLAPRRRPTHVPNMILLPRSWSLQRARAAVSGTAWLLVGIEMFGNYREACGADGWGSFIVVTVGVLVLVLLSVSAPNISTAARLLRLTVGALLLLPGSILLQAMFKESIRFAC